MWNYYCLRFKNETQWNNAKTQFKIDSRPDVVQYSLPTIWYEEDVFVDSVKVRDGYAGPRSTLFHVNLAIFGRPLPERAWPFVVKPVFIKTSMNGSGLHTVIEPDNFEDVEDAKIYGVDVTGPQLASLADEPDFSTLVIRPRKAKKLLTKP